MADAPMGALEMLGSARAWACGGLSEPGGGPKKVDDPGPKGSKYLYATYI